MLEGHASRPTECVGLERLATRKNPAGEAHGTRPTPALIIGLFTWLQRDMRELRREMNERFKEINKRVTDEVKRVSDDVKTLTSEVHQRFDQVNCELGENRERMAKLEGSLDGFLAGRRDRDAA